MINVKNIPLWCRIFAADDAYEWVREFWHAFDHKDTQRMRSAIGELEKMGLFPPEFHRRMPTIDELDSIRF